MFNEALKKATPRAENGAVNVFLETPKDSRHKYDLDQSGLFSISIEMPEGQAFPFSFGFIPGTEVADGDCLDVILITTGSAPAGALIQARLIGVLKMENDEEGEMVRNDRLVAVANMSRAYRHIGTLGDLHNGWVWDAEVFFETYNRMIERPFKIVGTGEKDEAYQMLEEAEKTR
ncbi:MAG: inorganic diphosphatase [Limimaricola soesokkakensis]|uniref:inorganic diphosphatase n=1 Tax=Limimaricola soesokkakensis TaxID=1343159 RepID=UPI004058E39D